MEVTNCTCPRCKQRFDTNVARSSKKWGSSRWHMFCRSCGEFWCNSSEWDKIYKDVPQLDFTPPASFLHTVIHKYVRDE